MARAESGGIEEDATVSEGADSAAARDDEAAVGTEERRLLRRRYREDAAAAGGVAHLGVPVELCLRSRYA